MATYILSGEADIDIQDIAESSIQQWGLARAEKYVLGLHEATAAGRISVLHERMDFARHFR